MKLTSSNAGRPVPTSGMIRRLGGARWQMLPCLIYLGVIAGAIRYHWLVKSDERAPLRFAAVVTIVPGYPPIAVSVEVFMQACSR